MYNKVTLIGNIGKDPEGQAPLKLSLATSRKAKGEMKTNWHNLVIFSDQLKALCHQYVRKGSKILVEGELDYNQYKDKWYTSIIVHQIRLLDSRSEGQKPNARQLQNDLDDQVPF